MLNKIKSIFAVVNIKPAQEINSFKPNVVQEDQKETQTRKRVACHIEQNSDLLLARGLRPHGADCEDNVHCTKEDCWKFVPDNIVEKKLILCHTCKRENCGTPLECTRKFNAKYFAKNKKT